MARKTFLQFLRGSAANLSSITPDEGEPIYDTTKQQVRVGDGSTPGGVLVGHAPQVPGFEAGAYYYPNCQTTVATNASLTANAIIFVPWVVGAPASFDRIGVQINSAGSASDKARVGIYDSQPAANAPFDLLVDSGELVLNTTGRINSTIDVSLDPGLYWLAVVCNSVTPSFKAHNYLGMLPWLGNTGTGVSYPNLLFNLHTFGALPSRASVLSRLAQNAPLVELRAS